MTPRCLPALAALLLAASALAEPERDPGVHVHGAAELTLALVAGELAIELILPGMDAVGFEHPARTEEQRAALATTIARLEATGDWLAFDPASVCRVSTASAHSHGYGDGDGDGEHEHARADDDDHGDADSGDHHDDGDHDGDHGHAEFHLSVKGECLASPRALELALWRHFPALQRIRVDLVTDQRQDRLELSGGRTRVPLSD